MKITKIFLSILLVLTMLAGLMPLGVLADGTAKGVTAGFMVVDCVNGEIEVMRKALTAEPGLALKYLDGQYGESTMLTSPVGENDVTPIDVLVAAHIAEYGEAFTDASAEDYITGFDYLSKIFGIESDVTYTVNGIMPYTQAEYGDAGYAANQYIVQPGDEICFYLIDYMAYSPSVYASFDRTETEATVSEKITVNLGFCATMGYSDSTIPAGGASIYALNEDGSMGDMTAYTADENGNVTVAFDAAGTYYLTCGGNVTYFDPMMGFESEGVLSPAYIRIVVTEEPELPVPEPEGEYDVTVNVGPATARVEFYKCAGFDENGYDILGSKINTTDNGINDDTSYHVYSMKLDKGTYSFRATDADGNSLGGMTFDIPTQVEVDNIQSKSEEIYLKQIDVYTTTKIDGMYATEEQYSTEVLDAEGRRATVGRAYRDSSSRTRYPYMVYANGNAELYTIKTIPSDIVRENYNLGTGTIINQAISKGTTVELKNSSLPVLINAVISAPKGSKVQVFNQLRNFYNEEVAYTGKTEAEGIASYTFRLPKGNGNHTYRVSMPGKITKAGYLNLNSEDKAKTDITFAENEDPEVRPVYDQATRIGTRLEDNILLNINPQNYLRMNVGGTFKARAYRAWQIINTDTANIMIEPDYEYKIISGDSITLEQQGQNAVLKAVKNGISLVEVTYDAIEIGGNTTYTGVYGAIDPMRKGLFAVNVGGDTSTEVVMPEWDSDFDTIYFTEETGTYNFAPTSAKEMTVKCNDEEITANADGTYTLTINQGNNIVSVTAGETTEYVIIKGNKVTVNIKNATSPGETIKQGDTVKISFDGLHMPMPKFSGIYNPGYGGTIKASYKTADGRTVQSNGTQYDFITNHTISMTVYEKGTVELTDGTIPFTSMGFVPGSHRELTDMGVGANFNAVAVPAEFCHLPDISFEVFQNNDASYLETARESYANLSKVSILWGTSSYQKAFSFELSGEKNASVKNKIATFSNFNSEFPLIVSATPVNAGVNMEFRYWELGDSEKKKAELTPGGELTIESPFSGEKPIYIEIAVTPKNPVFGEEKVYSYVVYKNAAGFERPVLKTLNIKAADGSAFAEPFGVLRSDNNTGLAYTETDYYCYIPSNTESVILSLARVNGTSDITIGEETKSVGTKETAFSSVATTQAETTVAITLADGGVYNVKLIKTDKVMEKKIRYDGERIAVSFINPAALDLDFIVTGYDKNNAMTKTRALSRELPAGGNTVYISYADFADEANIKLFVWDKELSPVINSMRIK